MKSLLVLLVMVISYNTLAKNNPELNFREPIRVQKVKFHHKLPQNLQGLYKVSMVVKE